MINQLILQVPEKHHTGFGIFSRVNDEKQEREFYHLDEKREMCELRSRTGQNNRPNVRNLNGNEEGDGRRMSPPTDKLPFIDSFKKYLLSSSSIPDVILSRICL